MAGRQELLQEEWAVEERAVWVWAAEELGNRQAVASVRAEDNLLG